MEFDVLSLLYRRNLLWQQAEVRWRAFQVAGRLITRRHSGKKGCILSALALVTFLFDLALGGLLAWLWTELDAGKLLEDAAARYTLSTLRVTRELLAWVMGSPAGLKLNAPLGHFLGSRCLYILGFWELFYRDFISRYLPSLLSLLPPLTSSLGLSLTLSLLHDFFKFLNLCLICFHIFSSRLLSLQLSALVSLGRLFMGRKWNVLRKRVDSCDYQTSQLLVGTILFTTLLFLLPTTGAFAFLFFSLRVAQWAVQLMIRSVVVCINWSTFTVYRMIGSAGRDASLLSARVMVGGEGVGRGGGEDVWVVWNGKRWSVEEMKALVERCDVNCVLGDVLGVRSEGEEAIQHPLATIAGLWTTF